MAHALGFDHEQNRPDRDDWIRIDFNNAVRGEFNYDFGKLNQTEFRDFDTPYDYSSIMRYHSYAHTINSSSITIRALKPPPLEGFIQF